MYSYLWVYMNRFSAALTAGFLGTVPFLGFVRAFPKPNRFELELIDTATGLISSDEQTAKILKLAIPLTLGSAFALPYALLWARGCGRPNLATGAMLGVAHGLAIILAKPVFRLAHPRPFRLPQNEVWVVGEVVNHVLYGVTVAFCYRALAKPEPKRLIPGARVSPQRPKFF